MTHVIGAGDFSPRSFQRDAIRRHRLKCQNRNCNLYDNRRHSIDFIETKRRIWHTPTSPLQRRGKALFTFSELTDIVQRNKQDWNLWHFNHSSNDIKAKKSQLFKYKLAGSCSLDWTLINSHRERFDDKVSIDIYRRRRPWRRQKRRETFRLCCQSHVKNWRAPGTEESKKIQRV